MEELYVEDFFKKVQRQPKGLDSSKPLDVPLVAAVEKTDYARQMKFYLDQLENQLALEFKNSADFQFLITKIKVFIQNENRAGVYQLLTDLEELMDLS